MIYKSLGVVIVEEVVEEEEKIIKIEIKVDSKKVKVVGVIKTTMKIPNRLKTEDTEKVVITTTKIMEDIAVVVEEVIVVIGIIMITVEGSTKTEEIEEIMMEIMEAIIIRVVIRSVMVIEIKIKTLKQDHQMLNKV